MKNPNWHPEAMSQLTVAQRRNLRLIFRIHLPHVAPRERVSFESLVRHGLATRKHESYAITAKGLKFLKGEA